MDYLEIPRLRLNRALEHINEFMHEADVFLKTNPFDVVSESYTEEGRKFIVFRFRVHQEPPKRLGIIVGECVHNLRSVLDNIIWSLGELYPLVDPRISFPVCKNAAQYEAALKNDTYKGINNFPLPARTLIENLQPYRGGYAEAAEVHPIYVLNRLWNDDKHRAPALMGAVNSGVALRGFTLGQPASISAGLAINDGVEIARGVLLNADSEPRVEFDREIAFHTSGPAKGLVASHYLSGLHGFVKNEVIEKFASVFP